MASFGFTMFTVVFKQWVVDMFYLIRRVLFNPSEDKTRVSISRFDFYCNYFLLEISKIEVW